MSQREVTDNKALENHASAVMTSGQPPGSFGHQRVLAHTAIFVDLFIDGRIGVSPVWGPFRPFWSGHSVAVASAHRRLARLVADWRSVQPDNFAFHEAVRNRRCLPPPTARRLKSGCS